jgi:cyclopropane fatty-acyl-phospholipid synthase-like methyltransferase
MSRYDRDYSTVDRLFGNRAESTLVEYADRIPDHAAVLDVGCGQGRNSLHVARLGHPVHALDPSTVAGRTVAELAAAESLPVVTFVTDLASFEPPVPGYGGIMVFGLIPILTRGQVAELGRFIERWTLTRGLVWLTAFTTEDPRYATHATQWQAVAENSFRGPDGDLRTYLEAGEVLTVVPGFEVLHHREALGPEHQHGDSEPERHAWAELVLRRP